MKLDHGLHLAYCTNVHEGETWEQTFQSLQNYTLAVREKVCTGRPYGIGLRLSDHASRELSERETLLSFRRWLDQHHCYVFTINGFPFGRFHGGQIKERVYAPDWSTPERLAYTNRLFELLSQLVPPGIEGSVSTVPGSFKEFIKGPDYLKAIRTNLWHSVEHAARVSEQTGRKMHLGLEPEPLCLIENVTEVMHFFDRLRAEHPRDWQVASEYLGITYDTCHMAVEFEEPAEVMRTLKQHQIKVSKIQMSSALKVRPTPQAREALQAFADDTYLHQVVACEPTGQMYAYRDLADALSDDAQPEPEAMPEWRIHFHVPLHSATTELLDNTTDHLTGVLDQLATNPALCSHLEIETYTWDVLPTELKEPVVVDQIVAEYGWVFKELAKRRLCVLVT